MPLFNYKEKIVGLPDDWKQNTGAGIKIAIIDSGAHLAQPGLQHLDVSGRKFAVAADDFDPDTAEGNDDISDSSAVTSCHGTQLLSILGGKPNADEGVHGLVPDAEIFIIKMTTSTNSTRQKNLIKALKLCVRLDVDLVTNASAMRKISSSAGEVEAALKKLEEKNTLFVSHLRNTTVFDRLNKPPFPSNYDYSLAIGATHKDLLRQMPDNPVFSEHVNFLFPPVRVKTYSSTDNPNGSTREVSSSHSTAIFTGLAALFLAKEKANNPNFSRKSKSEIIEAIESICPKFSKSDMLNDPKFNFFHTNKPTT